MGRACLAVSKGSEVDINRPSEFVSYEVGPVVGVDQEVSGCLSVDIPLQRVAVDHRGVLLLARLRVRYDTDDHALGG